jgi:hypothetical protein
MACLRVIADFLFFDFSMMSDRQVRRSFNFKVFRRDPALARAAFMGNIFQYYQTHKISIDDFHETGQLAALICLRGRYKRKRLIIRRMETNPA